MDIEKAKLKFWKGKPILKEQLRPFMNTESDNTYNQKLSQLVKEGVLRRAENGIYYFPHEEEPFIELGPSLRDVVHLKYLRGLSGIRTGAFIAYKYKLTTQVSGYYEIITNNVSKSTRGKKEYEGYVLVKSSKFEINIDNIDELEFVELVNNRKYSDYNKKTTLEMLIEIYNKYNFDEDKIREIMRYYGGQVNKGLRDTLNIVIEKSKKDKI